VQRLENAPICAEGGRRPVTPPPHGTRRVGPGYSPPAPIERISRDPAKMPPIRAQLSDHMAGGQTRDSVCSAASNRARRRGRGSACGTKIITSQSRRLAEVGEYTSAYHLWVGTRWRSRKGADEQDPPSALTGHLSDDGVGHAYRCDDVDRDLLEVFSSGTLAYDPPTAMPALTAATSRAPLVAVTARPRRWLPPSAWARSDCTSVTLGSGLAEPSRCAEDAVARPGDDDVVAVGC
jgi:hypothetical protein